MQASAVKLRVRDSHACSRTSLRALPCWLQTQCGSSRANVGESGRRSRQGPWCFDSVLDRQQWFPNLCFYDSGETSRKVRDLELKPRLDIVLTPQGCAQSADLAAQACLGDWSPAREPRSCSGTNPSTALTDFCDSVSPREIQRSRLIVSLMFGGPQTYCR